MRKVGRLGDQHKVARVTNDRTMATALRIESGLAPDPTVARRHEPVANT
jgi:hypothetical protein